MIPAIGYMIGVYIMLRCVEILSLPDTHFVSKIGGSVTRIFAFLVFIIAPLMMFVLASAESAMPTIPRL